MKIFNLAVFIAAFMSTLAVAQSRFTPGSGTAPGTVLSRAALPTGEELVGGSAYAGYFAVDGSFVQRNIPELAGKSVYGIAGSTVGGDWYLAIQDGTTLAFHRSESDGDFVDLGDPGFGSGPTARRINEFNLGSSYLTVINADETVGVYDLAADSWSTFNLPSDADNAADFFGNSGRNFVAYSSSLGQFVRLIDGNFANQVATGDLPTGTVEQILITDPNNGDGYLTTELQKVYRFNGWSFTLIGSLSDGTDFTRDLLFEASDGRVLIAAGRRAYVLDGDTILELTDGSGFNDTIVGFSENPNEVVVTLSSGQRFTHDGTFPSPPTRVYEFDIEVVNATALEGESVQIVTTVSNDAAALPITGLEYEVSYDDTILQYTGGAPVLGGALDTWQGSQVTDTGNSVIVSLDMLNLPSGTRIVSSIQPGESATVTLPFRVLSPPSGVQNGESFSLGLTVNEPATGANVTGGTFTIQLLEAPETYTFVPGWNAWTQTIAPTTGTFSASDLTDQGARLVARYENGSWDLYGSTLPTTDFEFQPGEGLFVLFDTATDVTLNGVPIGAQALDLAPGWSLIGVPVATSPNFGAASLEAAVNSAGGSAEFIALYDTLSGDWDVYVSGYPELDFSIGSDQGVFVYAPDAVTFTP